MTETAGAKVLRKLDGVSSPFFFSSRRRHTRCGRDWSSDVCSSDLELFHLHVEVPVKDLEVKHAVLEDETLHAQQGTAGVLYEPPAVLHWNHVRLGRSAELDQPGLETRRVHVQPGRLRVHRQALQIGANEIAEVLQVVQGLDPVNRDFLSCDLVNKPLQLISLLDRKST